MRKTAWTMGVTAAISALACGGSTSDTNGSADASVDVSLDVRADVQAMDVVLDTENDSNVCDPNLPDAYVPTWTPPHARSTACTTGQIQSYFDTCVGKMSSSPCTSFANANPACVACLITPLGAMSYGPMISWRGGDALEANVAGCMALVDGDLTANGCGAKYGAWQSCFIEACDTCPAGTFPTCAAPAQSGACGAYEAAAMQCYGQSEYAACKQTTFETYFTAYGAMFCASGASDAGGQ